MFDTIEPKNIWQHFKDINAIPRGSTREEEISAFMIAFGEALKLPTTKDSIGNVLIRKPASSGKETCKTVVLQGHLDMVHEKSLGTLFDFDRQGIQMYIEDDWVRAKETTLGADNGIGVAAIMAVLSSNEIAHPPIEALFTVDEEKGMTGALSLNKTFLDGSYFLNLDSEEDDILTIGCAGGVDIEISGLYSEEHLNHEEYSLQEISLSNLTGGHSGVDIHLESANAILVFAELLEALIKATNCRIHTVEFGSLTNVIPSKGVAVIAVPTKKLPLFETTLNEIFENIRLSYSAKDPHMSILLSPKNMDGKMMDEHTQDALIKSLLKIPNGVCTMTQEIPDLVQTSNNIAVLNISKGTYNLKCHVRSSIDSERDSLAADIHQLFSFAQVKSVGPYPGWKPKANTGLLTTAKNCYFELNGHFPEVKSIHAGLECGIFSKLFPQMEMISFGPNILGAHTTEERVQISSVQKFWKFLIQLLTSLA